jgi:poly(hydroxyalkanoate) granule-associated protein
MATKAKAKAKSKLAEAAAAPEQDDTAIKNIAAKMLDSAQQIWLAGLGAFSKAQDEGGKWFETLVREGGELEKATRKLTTAKVDEVRDAVETTVTQVRQRATDSWDRLEQVFEDRVSRALARLGIPGRDDLVELTAKIDELQKAVKALQKANAAPKSTAEKAEEAVAEVAKAVKSGGAKATKVVRSAKKKVEATVEAVTTAAKETVEKLTEN